MPNSNRREFLKSSAVATTAALAVPAIARAQGSPNDRVRVGLVGLGGRMSSHVAALAQMDKENVEIVAICDCDQDRLGSAADRYPGLAGKKLTTYTEQRKLFDDKAIDAVSFATQDHWHALQTIWACQAGKDVYVEKPATHNIWEGRKMVEAARKYGRMVQIGTQNRSSPNVMEGIRQLKEGVIGEVYMGRGMSYKPRGSLGKHAPRPVPKGLDWDAWVGPAKMVEYSHFQHLRWYWNSNFASGDIANQTVHDLDIIRWGMNLDQLPVKVQSMGGRYFPTDDDADTPSTQTFSCQYANRNVLVTFEIRNWYTPNEANMGDKYPFVSPGQCVGVIFFGSKGYMIIPDYSSFYTFMGDNHEPGPSKAAEGHPMEDLPHFQNWVKAIRSRKVSDLNADVEQGHFSTATCHLAKISCALGRSVEFDPKTERFVNDPEADKLLTREYRKPYVVPDVV
jgi:predicted dehydrogenase